MVTNWLIEQGVDMNPIDRWGMTPLEGAASATIGTSSR